MLATRPAISGPAVPPPPTAACSPALSSRMESFGGTLVPPQHAPVTPTAADLLLVQTAEKCSRVPAPPVTDTTSIGHSTTPCKERRTADIRELTSASPARHSPVPGPSPGLAGAVVPPRQRFRHTGYHHLADPLPSRVARKLAYNHAGLPVALWPLRFRVVVTLFSSTPLTCTMSVRHRALPASALFSPVQVMEEVEGEERRSAAGPEGHRDAKGNGVGAEQALSPQPFPHSDGPAHGADPSRLQTVSAAAKRDGKKQERPAPRDCTSKLPVQVKVTTVTIGITALGRTRENKPTAFVRKGKGKVFV
ncbi:hypothetical protein B0H17DRAFT_1223165 [Mycena rosella]|uniref:Uncharacterized protein n=1 Tax=Mycena rosella TaxID=1033263 RepID=A0AAD7F5B2_MYCRO|nr:hypothetical protein B0H17DRAFT_1223165 [Mycena rosella]